jgi:phage gp46-like protein
MAMIAKALRSMVKIDTVDRIVLVACVIAMAVLVLQVRSTVAGMDVSVVLGSAETAQR